MTTLIYAVKYWLLNVIGPLVPHPKLRSRYLRLLGARIGHHVRVENVRFIQIQGSIGNLELGDDAFIGSNVTLDLSAPIVIGRSSIVAPGCTLLTHQDFGDFNGNAVARLYPRKELAVRVGDHVVIGSDTTVLAGAEIGSFVVIGAKSLVNGVVPGNSLFIGVPARLVRTLNLQC